jgi:hypothetical protein
MDSECLKPLDPERRKGDVLLARMGKDPTFEHALPNALMASRPYQLFWLLYVALIIEKISEAKSGVDPAKPEDYTGPIVLKEAVEFYCTSDEGRVRERCAGVLRNLPSAWTDRVEAGRLTILGAGEWYALDWTNPMHRKLRQTIIDQRVELPSETVRRLFPNATLITYWSHSW